MTDDKDAPEDGDAEVEQERISLEQLSGAVLKWTDPDGTERSVEFDE